MNAKKAKALRKACKKYEDVKAEQKYAGGWGMDANKNIIAPVAVTLKHPAGSRRRIYQDAKRKFGHMLGTFI